MTEEIIPVELKELSQKHKTAMSLLAQGLGRTEIASIVDYTPEYITWLAKQPLCKAYLQELTQYVDARLVALYEKSVDVMADAMTVGNMDEKLRGARLQLEATWRVGRMRDAGPSGPADDDRLERLAQRLVTLLHVQRERTVNGEVLDAEIIQGDASRQERVEGEVSRLQPNPT